MTATYKPPLLGPDTSYDSCRREIEIWQRVTELPKKKQALAVTLSLSDKYREVATEIDIEVLNSDNGIDELFKVLDNSFRQETVDSSFAMYMEFESFQRGSLSVLDFILEFERRYKKLTRLKMALPEEILGCKLLAGSGLDAKEKQKILTSVKTLKFEEVKVSMRRIFSAITENARNNDDLIIKGEAFMTKSRHKNPKPSYQNEKTASGVSKRVNPKNK